MSDYKTFEELKEELGDKFEDYMYKANIELLNKLQQKENIIKEVREYIDKNNASLPMGRDEFTCEMRYSDPVVLAHKVLEILDKAGDEK